jgi:hypothetical protein
VGSIVIKSFSAFTHEVDDVYVAVSEIVEQLDLNGKNHLLQNTIGIVSCFSGFIESGVWAAISKALPFGIWGTTTMINSSAGEIGETMLTILVLTSDDVSFSAALSEPITEESAEPLTVLYKNASAQFEKKPSLMFSFSPLFTKISNSYYVEKMSAISSGVPNFGTVAVDHNSDYHESFVLSNGESYNDRFAIVLFHGNVNPSFYVGTISDEKLFPEKGVVTATEGNVIKMVNGLPVIKYLESIGLTKNENGEIVGLNTFPIIVDYNDGTPPVAQAMLALTPEDNVVCGDKIIEGSTLGVGSFNPEELVITARRTLQKALSLKNHHTMLMYSCIGRFFALGYDSLKELQQVQELMEGNDISYISAYAGGEICPVYDKKGEPVNRNHGSTFIICAF